MTFKLLSLSAIAYNAGRQAFHDGEELDANPYPAGTPEAADWLRGWHDAKGE